MVFGNHFVSISKPLDLNEAKVNAFVNEIDLTNNLFVKNYIKSDGCDSITLPYVYAPRFEVRKDFDSRENKAMAVGTASTCEGIKDQYNLYRELYKTVVLIPDGKPFSVT